MTSTKKGYTLKLINEFLLTSFFVVESIFFKLGIAPPPYTKDRIGDEETAKTTHVVQILAFKDEPESL